MSYQKVALAAVAVASISLGCTNIPLLSDESSGGAAAIVGRVVVPGGSAKLLSASGRECPEVRVSVNGTPVSIDFDDDCSFVIDGIQPAELVSVRVELVDLGVAGTIELLAVADGELIEIAVEPRSGSLTVAIERRTKPAPSGDLPSNIEGNNVSIRLPAGTYDQALSVRGNNFTLVGEAGSTCDTADGWTVITGDVTVKGNNATFRNIRFAGSVTLQGNNARFIHCCFGGRLIVFGNNTDIGDTGGKHDNDDDDHDDDDD